MSERLGGKVDLKFLVLAGAALFLFFLLSQFMFQEEAFHAFSILMGVVVFALTLVKTEWALVILIFATLLSPELDVGKVGSRVVTIRIEDVLLVVLVFTWLAKIAINKEIGFLRKTPLNNAIKAFVVVCVVSTLLGIYRGNVFPPKGIFFVLKYVEYFVLYFIVINNIYQDKQVKLLLGSFFAVCFVICLVALADFGEKDRLSAPFEGEAGEPNTFGGYLLFLFSLCCGLFLKSEQGKQRLLYGGLGALTLFTLFFTLSRGSYFGLIGAYFVFLILVPKKRGLLLGLAALLAIFIVSIPGPIQQRILYTFSVWKPEITAETVYIQGVALDPSASARITSWKLATKDLTERPILGYGVSGSGLIDNQYFTVFIETGVVGFVAFIYLLVQLFRMGRRAQRRETVPYYQGLYIGWLAGFVGLLFHALTANTFILIRVMEPFWFLTAIIAHMHGSVEEEAAPEYGSGKVGL